MKNSFSLLQNLPSLRYCGPAKNNGSPADMNSSMRIKLLILTALAFGFSLAFGAPPAFDTIGGQSLANGAAAPDQSIPCGKTLVVPVTASDADGDPIIYSVTSNNPKILARVKTGNPALKLHVANGGSAPVVTLDFTQWDGNACTVTITGPRGPFLISIPSRTTGAAVITLEFSGWDGNPCTVTITGPSAASLSIPGGTAGSVPQFDAPSGWTKGGSGTTVTLTSNAPGSGNGVSVDDNTLGASIRDGTEVDAPTGWKKSASGNAITFTATGAIGFGYGVSTNDSTLSATVQQGVAAAGNPSVMAFLLFNDLAPKTSAIIEGLAQGGFYNGLTFNRVVPGFAIQGGDPNGDTSGGPGFTFDNEFHPGLIFTGNGQLAMANSGFDSTTFAGTNGSQFFITLGPQRPLDFNHTIFGQLVRNFNVPSQIAAVQTGPNPRTGENSFPVTPVTITSAEVVPDNTDAVLYLSADGVGTATITVGIWDGKSFGPNGKTPALVTKTFTATGVADTTNDPPILVPPGDGTTATNTSATVRVQAVDLEFDYMTFISQMVTQTNDVAISGANPFEITPSNNFKGAFDFAVGVEQLNATSRGSVSSPFDVGTISLALGDKQLHWSRKTFNATAGVVATNVVVAQFGDEDLTAVPGDFTASINWGDGSADTAVTAGVVAADTVGTTKPPTVAFKVTGSHTYASIGTYPVRVTITDNKGGADAHVDSTAEVWAGPLMAQGTDIVAKGSFNGAVATFTTTISPAVASSHHASINWGDGNVTAGKIVANKTGGGFSVIGSHAYIDAEPFSVFVTISDAAGHLALVRSTIHNTSAKGLGHFPPFAQSHLVGSWIPDFSQGPIGPFQQTVSPNKYITGTIIVLNSGNKTLPKATLNYYLSPTPTLNKSTATLLTVNPNTTSSLSNLGPGFGKVIPFAPPFNTAPDTRIAVPNGQDAIGKYLLIELVYSDPLTDNEAVDKVISGAAIVAHP
jgi:cyclophilin family peptidyl-prolyl cis-trans isomerase